MNSNVYRRPIKSEIKRSASDKMSLKRAPVHVEATISRLHWLASLMDSAFRVPGTSRTIGLDSLIGLIPGFGDLASAAVSAEFVRQAIRLGARKRVVGRMVANIGLDMLIGTVPLLGDIFDFAFKANVKNAKLLEEELHFTYSVDETILNSSDDG